VYRIQFWSFNLFPFLFRSLLRRSSVPFPLNDLGGDGVSWHLPSIGARPLSVL